MQYFYVAILSLVMGGSKSLALRFEHSTPMPSYLRPANIHGYNAIPTSHATTMILYVVTPYIFGFMANYFIPVILWIPDMAFPRWNLLAVQTHTGAAFLNVLAALGLSPASGWTMYPPMSTLDISTNTDLASYSLLLLSISSIMNAIVTITTIMVYRPKDMDVIDLPMWMGGVLTSSWLILLVLPVPSTSFFLLLSDKHLQSSYFLDPRYGGDFLL